MQVYKFPVQDCDSYVTCSSCLAASDPFCGWCTMQARSVQLLFQFFDKLLVFVNTTIESVSTETGSDYGTHLNTIAVQI